MALGLSWWWPLSPWLSPGAAWFIFFNAVVGAIAVMSRSAQQQGGASRRRLCRSASSMVLDRLRSFSVFYVHPASVGGVTGAPTLDGDGDGAVSGQRYYTCSREAEEPPRPSLPLSETAACIAPTSAPAATASAEDHAASAPETAAAAPAEDHGAAEQSKTISLDEAYALAQQHCRPQLSPTASAIAPAAAAAARPRKMEPAKATKRRAQACGRREAEAAPEGKAELNARAERFIMQFREDLRLQRLNSILNHTHALGADAGASTSAP